MTVMRLKPNQRHWLQAGDLRSAETGAARTQQKGQTFQQSLDSGGDRCPLLPLDMSPPTERKDNDALHREPRRPPVWSSPSLRSRPGRVRGVSTWAWSKHVLSPVLGAEREWR